MSFTSVQEFVEYVSHTSPSDMKDHIQRLGLPNLLRLQASLIEMSEIVEQRFIEMEEKNEIVKRAG